MGSASSQIRLVLDTNLFIGTYWNRTTASARIIQACIDGLFQAYFTQAINRELDRILRNIRAKPEFIELINEFRRSGVVLDNTPSSDVRTADPDDQKFLDCALAAEADYLITNDDHLLSLHDVGRTLIVRPSTFWKEVGLQGNERYG